MTCAKRGHACQCGSMIPTPKYEGALLRATAERLTARIASHLPLAPDRADVFVAAGPGWEARLREAADQFKPTEQTQIRAVGIDAGGAVDLWSQTTLDLLVARIESPWFPEVLNRGLLTMHFQPIVDLASGHTYAFEALTRASLGDRFFGAGEVIGAARGHEAIFQFDQAARREAIVQGFPGLTEGERLFINFMPQVIYDPEVCLARTWAAAKQVGCELSSLVFEVVESEDFPDLAHLQAILDSYRERGAAVALDDVGTGKTALSYIDVLRPDYIKLAGDLLPLRPSPKDLSMIAGLVDHAHFRDIKVLVEGIETEEQLIAAQTLGAELGQGYHFAKPAREMVRPERRSLRSAA